METKEQPEGWEIRKIFQDFAKDKRLAKGMSQEKFAEFLFGDKRRKSFISAIESGKNIKLATMEQFLHALDGHFKIEER